MLFSYIIQKYGICIFNHIKRRMKIMNNTYKKDILNTEFEVSNLSGKFDELSDMDDLWYFIRSSAGV